MAKLLLSSSALALVLAIPAVASAQSAPAQGNGTCPPGSWFCSDAPDTQPTPAGQPVQPQLQALPDPDAPPPPPPRVRRLPGVTYAPAPQQPPVVVYQPPPPVMVGTLNVTNSPATPSTVATITCVPVEPTPTLVNAAGDGDSVTVPRVADVCGSSIAPISKLALAFSSGLARP